MSAAHEAKLHPSEKIEMGPLSGHIFRVFFGLGLACLILAVVFGFVQGDHGDRYFNSYIVAFTYALTFPLGALFFIILQPLTRSQWSPVVRRLAECMTSAFVPLGFLSLGLLIPMAMSASDPTAHWGPYHHWLHYDPSDHILKDKAGWLNFPFFAIRVVIYFVAWYALSRYFVGRSLQQDDSGDPQISENLRVASAPAMLAFALTLNFAAFDLLMSLDPHWFSTIFGVYYFAGCAITIFSSLILVGMYLQRAGILMHSITTEHYHDLGKLLFAFVFFWSYIAFSQFMLIWYANIPEETIWYQSRMFTDWMWLSLLLLFGHCVFPFLFLLSRWTKRLPQPRLFFAVWMLVMHYFDMYFLVMPIASPEGPSGGALGIVIDLLLFVGMMGIVISAVARKAGKVKLIPVKDPKLGASLSFENF